MRALHRPGFLARLTETWFRRPAAPTRVVMDLTRRCNLRCEMCSTWKVEAGHELTPAEIRRVLGQMPRLSWIDVTGGEVFLRTDAREVFDAVLDAVPSLEVLHFPTNGWFTARVEEVARRVLARRPDLELIITVSVDGPRELHDRIRGRAGSFDRALATLRALRAIPGLAVYIGTTVTPSNAEHLDALEGALRQEVAGFRASEWHWNFLQISSHFFGNRSLPALPPLATKNLVLTHLRRRGAPSDLVDVMELIFLINLEFFRRGEPLDVVCQALRSTCFLSPEGDVYPCHVYDRPLGNVRERSVADIWNAPETRRAREDIEALACGGCCTPCEAYPALAGAPLQTLRATARRSLRLLRENA